MKIPDVSDRIVRSEECALAFSQMQWAFVFFFDLRVGTEKIRIDLLPDFIGWAIIASALARLRLLSPVVPSLRSIANGLVVLTLLQVIEYRISLIESGEMTVWLSAAFVLEIATLILDLIIIWKLCGLIMAMASSFDNPDVWNKAEFRRKLYVGFTIGIVVAGLVSFIEPELMLPVWFVAFPISILVLLLMVGLMNRTARMCRGVPPY